MDVRKVLKQNEDEVKKKREHMERGQRSWEHGTTTDASEVQLICFCRSRTWRVFYPLSCFLPSNQPYLFLAVSHHQALTRRPQTSRTHTHTHTHTFLLTLTVTQYILILHPSPWTKVQLTLNPWAKFVTRIHKRQIFFLRKSYLCVKLFFWQQISFDTLSAADGFKASRWDSDLVGRSHHQFTLH